MEVTKTKGWTFAACALLLLGVGCGAPKTPPAAKTVAKAKVSVAAKTEKKQAAPPVRPAANPSPPPLAPQPEPQDATPPFPVQAPPRLNRFEAMSKPVIDEERVAAQGIRKLQGKHLTLYTDLPSSPAIEELPTVFDAAVPQWQAYFGMADAKVADWKLWGYLMQDKEKFKAAGLYPDDLPDFPNGFQRGHELWLLEQPTDYYRRHLLLHEGTHGAMYHWLNGAGPPWYCEGMAELLGTHLWKDGKLVLPYMPSDKAEVEGWGRIKLLKDDYANKQAMTLVDVLKLSPTAHRENAAYAWSWAAAWFFDAHPRYQKAFRELGQHAESITGQFSADFLRQFEADIHTLQDEWQLFIGNCEYGYDVARNSLEVKPVEPLPAAGAKATIAADHGWQSTGYRLDAGQTYRITASGEFSLRQEPRVWKSEAAGVTIRYHRGLPLGMLLAAVRDDDRPLGITPLLTPTPIGVGSDFTPEQSGTLWLKINEFEGEWADNQGTLQVEIRPRS